MHGTQTGRELARLRHPPTNEIQNGLGQRAHNAFIAQQMDRFFGEDRRRFHIQAFHLLQERRSWHQLPIMWHASNEAEASK